MPSDDVPIVSAWKWTYPCRLSLLGSQTKPCRRPGGTSSRFPDGEVQLAASREDASPPSQHPDELEVADHPFSHSGARWIDGDRRPLRNSERRVHIRPSMGAYRASSSAYPATTMWPNEQTR